MPVVRYHQDFHAKILHSQYTMCYACGTPIRELPFFYLVWPGDYVYLHMGCALQQCAILVEDATQEYRALSSTMVGKLKQIADTIDAITAPLGLPEGKVVDERKD